MYRGKGGGALSMKDLIQQVKREKQGGGGDPEWFGAVRQSIREHNLVLRGCNGTEGPDWVAAPEYRLARGGAAYNLDADAMTYAAWRAHLCASICFSRATGSTEILLLRDSATGGADTYNCGHGTTFRKAGGIGARAQLVTRILLGQHPTANHEASAADLVEAVLQNLHLHL